MNKSPPNEKAIIAVRRKGIISSENQMATPIDGNKPMPRIIKFLLITLKAILKLMIWFIQCFLFRLRASKSEPDLIKRISRTTGKYKDFIKPANINLNE